MGFDRIAIKEKSKKIISSDLTKVIIIGIVVSAVGGNVPFVTFPTTVTITLEIVASIFSFGLAKFSLNKIRGEEASVEDVTYGFNYAGKIIIMAIVTTVLTSIGFALFIIPGIILTMMFSMSTFILVDDPTKSIEQCLKESKDLVYGVKGDLFIFYLSFAGWAILSSLLFGIGYFLLTPYIVLSEAQIYLKLKGLGQENDTIFYTENEPYGNSDNFYLKK